MSQLLGKKWWLILLQGILLIILSIYIFSNPAGVLAGISLWFGILVFGAGLVGIISWLTSSKAERESMSLLWGILTLAFGLLMLLNLLATMKSLTVIFGLWCLLSGVYLLKFGWSLKDTSSTGWVIVIAGLLCVVVAIMIIMNIGTGAVAISTLLGLQTLFLGIALVLLSFVKRTVVKNVQNKVEALR